MMATGASLSLALNNAAASTYPSLAVVLQPCVLLNSQRTLQWDFVVGENYSNKKKIFKAFSTFSSSSSSSSSFGATTRLSLRFPHQQGCKKTRVPLMQASIGKEPLRIMISGAPVSGKGTQCELIAPKVLNIEDQLLCLEVQAEAKETFDDLKKLLESFRSKIQMVGLKTKRKKLQNLRQITINDMFN